MNHSNPLPAPCPHAYAQAYADGFPLTVRLLIAKGAQFDLAEEVAQVAWARGWEALAQLRRLDSVQTWVNRIAYNCLCTHHRRKARPLPLVEVLDHRAPAMLAGVEARLLLKGCTPIERLLLMQSYIGGMSLAEIAAAQGVSEMTIRLRIHRCRHRLRALAGLAR